jgi:hypothetical protein
VLRSFGKFHGLAGLRLGFAITSASVAEKLRDALGPWAVSGPALSVGLAALADEAWAAATRLRLAEAAAALDGGAGAGGCRVLGGTSLFRLAEVPPGTYERLGRSGILVRRFRLLARPHPLRPAARRGLAPPPRRSPRMTLLLIALLVEAAFGYPDRVVRAIGHPVIWMGRLISALDRRLNRPTLEYTDRRAFGVLALGSSSSRLAGGDVLQAVLGVVLTGVVASSLLAQRSLYEHVARVAEALETGGIEAGREAVSHIVGRDPQTLDEAGVARAAIESLAENFSDGVVAPAFWIGIGGLPGGARSTRR